MFREELKNALIYHDLGKLAKENQEVLGGEETAKSLPIHHQDAGVVYLKSQEGDFVIPAMSASAHHLGYQDFAQELIREEKAFRDHHEFTIEKTDREVQDYVQLHHQLTGLSFMPILDEIESDPAVFARMVLSCLADADHTDTARHYHKYPQIDQSAPLRAKERLERLDRYISGLGVKAADDPVRHGLRGEMYRACRDADRREWIVSCDGPVGSGKTTAVMGNLLSQAIQRGLRRIIIVLPYTNIIKQSVEKYRQILVFPDEDPTDVVAELHHRADFQSKEARHLTALWRAPIIVTTAVAFFETLASNMPSSLRRLHELPGSAIFVDESHASLPVKLLPIAWRWINILADEWSCYWVLASGSLTRYWAIPEINEGLSELRHVPEIVGEDLRHRLSMYERDRLTYLYEPEPKGLETLSAWIEGFDGPRLVIMNTIQSAAVLAQRISEKDRGKVEHLSTALKPSDRELTLDRIKKRLANKGDRDWTLVATSCIEAGVDISFRNGFRELASLLSLLQAGGRVDREGIFKTSQMWTFCIAEEGKLRKNPGLEQAAEVLKHYFENNIPISPDISTDSIVRELRQYGTDDLFHELVRKECTLSFQYVAENFRVIDSNTEIVIDAPNKPCVK